MCTLNEQVLRLEKCFLLEVFYMFYIGINIKKNRFIKLIEIFKKRIMYIIKIAIIFII